MSMDGSRTYSTARTSATTNPSLLVQQQQQQGGGQGGTTVVTTGGGSVLTTQNNNDHFHSQQQYHPQQQYHTSNSHGINGDQRSVGGGGSIASLQQRNSCIIAQPQPAPLPSFYKMCGCIECYKPSREQLEYDYTYDDVPSSSSSLAGDPPNGVNGNITATTAGGKPPQSYPRIRERG